MATHQRESFKGYPPRTLSIEVSSESRILCSLIDWHVSNGADSEELAAVAGQYPDGLAALARDITAGLQAWLAEPPAEAEAGAPPVVPIRCTDGDEKPSAPAAQQGFIDFFPEV